MNDYNNSDLSGTEHKNGEIWSSALREIFDALVRRHGVTDGRRTADTLVLESMFGAPSDPTYAIIAQKLLDADRALNGGAHAATICSAFTARLILGASDCDAAPRGDVTLFQSPQQGLAIPDNAPAGITSTLDITDSRAIERLAVNVNIAHPSRGDLQILLTAPDGTTVDPAEHVRRPRAVHAGHVRHRCRSRRAARRLSRTRRERTMDADGRRSSAAERGTLLSWSLAITFAGDAPATIRPSSFAPRKIIAAVAHAPGALGTTWQTDVRLFNRGAATANVTAIFTHSGEEGWNHFAAVKLSIAPKQVMALDDVVAATMRTSGVGQLEFLGDTDALIITSRTYTRANGGTYGQFIPAVSTTRGGGDRVRAANPSHARFPHQHRIRGNGRRQRHGSRDAVRWRRTAASSRSRICRSCRSGRCSFPPPARALMTAELRVISGDARIVAYSSVIDNHSGDPIYVPAAAPRPGTFVAPVIKPAGREHVLAQRRLSSARSATAAAASMLTYTDAVTGERIVETRQRRRASGARAR